MLENTKALIEIAKSGAAQPAVPNAAVECMAWCVVEIERLRRGYGDLFDTLIEARNSKCSESLQEAIDKAALMAASQRETP